MNKNIDRRQFLQSSAALSVAPGLLVGSPAAAQQNKPAMLKREIPSSGETIPVIGLGTWQTFDVADSTSSRVQLKGVLHEFVSGGGSVVDSSPMYGSSERVVGELADELQIAERLFKATKVWTSGEAAGVRQMDNSMSLMRTNSMDLMQVHNLLDAETHLRTLAEWKQEGKVRYVGITHYHSGGYAPMMSLMKKHQLDFIQINYSMLSEEASREVLPLALDRGIAVLINRPYEAGRLFRTVTNQKLPPWAKEFDCQSWGQFFLKYLLANPAVTCVIPGTSKARHMRDNVAAGFGDLPNVRQRGKMQELITSF